LRNRIEVRIVIACYTGKGNDYSPLMITHLLGWLQGV